MNTDNPVADDSGTASAIRYAEKMKPFLDMLALVAALSVPFVAVRILSVSGWNQSVALGIVANSTISDLFVAFVLLAFPTWLYLVAMTLAVYVASPKTRGRLQKLIVLAIILAYSMLVARSWLEITVNAGFPLAVLIGFYLGDRRRASDEARTENIRFATAIIVSSLIGVVTSSTMWLPPERLVVAGKARQAYVIRETETNLVVFYSDDHAVVRIKTADISERQYCIPKYSSALFSTKAAGRPDCPR